MIHRCNASRRTAAALLFCATTAPVRAQVVDAPLDWQQPAQPLGSALTALALRTGLIVGVDAAAVRGRQAAALQGRYTPHEALQRLLAGSGLQAVRDPNGGYALRAAAPAPVPPTPAMPAGPALSAIRVDASRDTLTEGSGSYTTDAPLTSATRLPMTLRETPQSVSVITRERMQDQGLTQIADVLRQTPGLSFIQSGNAGTDANSVYARGFVVENYQVDGIPQTGSWLTQTGDLAFYDRVEVIRGATGLLNGVGTPAATINLVRKRPTRDFRASAALSAGAWNTFRGEVDLGGPLNEANTLRARLVAAAQDGDSWIDRHSERKKLLYGIVEADLAPATRLTAGVELQQHHNDGTARSGLPLYFSDGSLTNFARSQSAAARWAHSYQDQRQFFAALDRRFDNGWALHASFNQSRRGYDDVIGYALRGWVDRASGTGLGLWATRWNSQPLQNAADLHASGRFELFGRRHELVLGSNISRTKDSPPTYANWTIPGYDGSIPNFHLWNGDWPAEPFNPRTGSSQTTTHQTGVYATARLRPTDALSVILGARVSRWTERTRRVPFQGGASFGERSEKDVVTPYASVVWDFDRQWSAYASYTDIFKPQTHKAPNGDYLDPLVGKACEIGIKGALLDERLNLGAAVFEVRQDRLAVRLDNQFAPDGSAAYRAARGTTTRGYELEAAGELAPDWQIGAGYSHSVSRDAAGARLNTQVPKKLLKLFTSYRIAGIGHGLTVGGGLHWQSASHSRNLGPSGSASFTQGSYATLDLMARYQLSRQLSLAVALDNVFDKRYRTSTTTSFYGAPRNLRVTLHGTY